MRTALTGQRLLEVDQLDAVADLVAGREAEGLDQSVAGRVDGVLHLHRLQHQQRRALRDARAGGGDQRDHLARHRCDQAADGVFAGAADVQGVDQRQRPGAAFEEDHAALAAQHHRRVHAALAELRVQLRVRPGAPASEHAAPIDGQPVRAAVGAHTHRLQPLAVAQRDAARRLPIQPPAVELAPRRIAVGGAGRGLAGELRLTLQLGQRSQHPDLVGHLGLRREQVGVLALDQRGVEVGLRERRPLTSRAQELHVGRQADDARPASASRRRASAASRSWPQTISLAIIGS